MPAHLAAKVFVVALGLCMLGSPAQVRPPQAGAQNQFSVFVEPGPGEGPVLSLIGSARHSIKLEVYILTDRAVIQALKSARSRHVGVQVLLEQHPFGGTRYATKAYASLKSAGISVRWANEPAFTYTHEKSMVVDGRTAGIFTFNLSYSAFQSNREFGVVDRNVQDAQAIAGVFNADWSRRGYRLNDGRLVVSPINSRRALQGLVNGARHTLDLYEEELNDPAFESRLIAAARRGVRVRLLTSAGSAGVERLRAGHVEVRIQTSPYIHAKAIVADGYRVFIGSENVSTTSLDSNREMGILLSLKSQAQVVAARFGADWQNAAPGGPGTGGKGHLAVHVSTQPRSVVRGQLLRITAVSVAAASCTIKVTYPDGYVSRAKALRETTADSGGTARWGWHVGSTVKGTAGASVTCFTVKATGHGSASFRIR